jgi:hypothetical protein
MDRDVAVELINSILSEAPESYVYEWARHLETWCDLQGFDGPDLICSAFQNRSRIQISLPIIERRGANQIAR